MCVQVRKGRFVVLTEGRMGADSAFCMGGEQLWLGKVEQLGPNSVQLLMYKPQRNAAGEAAVHALRTKHHQHLHAASLPLKNTTRPSAVRSVRLLCMLCTQSIMCIFMQLLCP